MNLIDSLWLGFLINAHRYPREDAGTSAYRAWEERH